MTRLHLVLRGLLFYWRTHLAVVLGVATAVAVLSGALLVGDSVRGSLRDLVVERLGRTDQVVLSQTFFRESLAAAIAAQPGFPASFTDIAPLIAARAVVTDQDSGARAGEVAVYGVDDRFWRFHHVAPRTPADREALVSPALAAQLGAAPGRALLVRLQRPTDIPLESLHGRKDNVGRTIRVSMAGVVPREGLGEFSLEPQQGDVRAVFLPLSRLQQELDMAGRVNTLLVSARDASTERLTDLVRASAALEDFGLKVRPASDRKAFYLESDAGLLTDAEAQAAGRVAAESGLQADAVFTYLANTIRVGARELPYSIVTAADFRVSSAPPAARERRGDATAPAAATPPGTDAVILNRWAADDLGARVGDPLEMEYYLWQEPGRLVTQSARFHVAGIVPVDLADRELAPVYPGISDAPTLEDWDPPFPVDLRRIRPIDERYWNAFRTTPKAYISIEAGQKLWRSRHGGLTSLSVRVPAGRTLDEAEQAFVQALRRAVDPAAAGPAVRDVRQASLAASRGATDFGEYFVYFSFFLVASALLLAALFFKLGVEQRAAEVGLLRAVGFGPRDVRAVFLGEGLLIAIAGAALGAIGAVAYAALLIQGLRTWWVDAVGTTALTLHVSTRSLAIGVGGGIVIAVLCIAWTLRSLNRVSARGLLSGDLADAAARPGGHRAPSPARRAILALAAAALAIAGAALVAAGAAGWADAAGAFFGAGAALLTASIVTLLLVLRRRPSRVLAPAAWQSLPRLGLRNAAYRPARSVLAVAVIAAATFILISVDAFRRDPAAADNGRRSGLGGYALVVDTLLPIAHDPNTREGRDNLNLFDLGDAVRFQPFRVLPGDDASCLNLYEPKNPRILGVRDEFVREGRFAFAGTLASTEAERANPWLLLDRQEAGVVPVIADANSITYVLHRKIGDEIPLAHNGGTVRLRIVAALQDSLFQSELLMSEQNFLRLYPDQDGYRFLLVDVPPGQRQAVTAGIENAMRDLGADASTTADRLAQFHRVENTYLSTFQTLGGMGLLLGTIGLAAVLLRNVLERRRELALLGAVGYRPKDFLAIILSENVFLLACGLVIGAACAAVAIAPAVSQHGGRIPFTAQGAMLVAAVLAAGLLTSAVATRAATRGPLLSSLRSE